MKKLGIVGQNLDFRGPEIEAHRPISKIPNLNPSRPISSIISLFFHLFIPPKLPKSGHFSKKSYICTGIRPRDPSQMKDLLILRRIHLSKAPATFIRPTWWQKKVKNLKKGVSQTVFPLFSYQDGFLATWDPSQMKDLKILHQIHLTRALYDGIWPSLCLVAVTYYV